jgi:hypothetical protein
MRRFRTPVSWFAALAILLQALWPLLAHARPAETPILVPLCTIDNVTHYLELKTGKQSPLEQRSASHGDHCKLCVLGTDKVFIQSFFFFRHVEGKYQAPEIQFLSRSFFLDSRIALPRAPPAVF